MTLHINYEISNHCHFSLSKRGLNRKEKKKLHICDKPLGLAWKQTTCLSLSKVEIYWSQWAIAEAIKNQMRVWFLYPLTSVF